MRRAKQNPRRTCIQSDAISPVWLEVMIGRGFLTPMRYWYRVRPFFMILAICPSIVFADGMDGDEFAARMTGKTMFFTQRGLPYGVEQYLPGRRVIWSFLGGECQMGTWYEDTAQDRICFVYENISGPQCWDFFDRDGQISARIAGAPPEDDLMVVEESDEPIQCQLPGLGV